MKVLNCDMFKMCKSGDALCVTTNGVITKSGKLVMGAGIAKDFKLMFDGVDTILGKYVSKYGNRVFRIGKASVVVDSTKKDVILFSFPTKNDWKNKSDINLIEQSCIQLKEVVEKFKITGDIYLPAPGCKNGCLNWESDVKPVVEKYFPEDRYIICFKP